MARLLDHNDKPVTRLPVRLAWTGRGPRLSPGSTDIKGTPGTTGDAGWSVYTVTPEEAAQVVTDYPQARMPCWARFRIEA